MAPAAAFRNFADDFGFRRGSVVSRGGTRCGAGRPARHVKAEHCLSLDVRELARRKLLRNCAFTWRWTNPETGKESGSIGVTSTTNALQLRFSSNGAPVHQHVHVERTQCHYGGTRPWLRCPRCARRIAVLFLRDGKFRCRHCGRVAYASQSDDAIDSTWRKQAKQERKLGAHWARPKGMHRITRQRILNIILGCEERRELELAQFLSRYSALLWDI